MPVTAHIGVDLGASGGRVALGIIEKGKLRIEVVHRFANGPVLMPRKSEERLFWDIKELFAQILVGLGKASERAKEQEIKILSVGVDSWAVDYGLLDKNNHLIGGVHHYRDPRTTGVKEEFLKTHVKEEIYRKTGTQFQPFNTLYQLIAHLGHAPADLARATTLLMVPDLLHYWLSGVIVCERTNASTTQFYDPILGDWADEFTDWTTLPKSLLPKIVDPGTVIGELLPEIQEKTGLAGVKVVVPTTHDTAAAIAAVPAQGEDWGYISSGTWSLVGIEAIDIYSSHSAFKKNFTNEAGINGTNRFLKNVMGLWILQECRHGWGNLEFPQIYEEAQASPEFFAYVNPDDNRFLAPGNDMPERVQAACLDTNQVLPKTRGQIARCVLESLAFKYRYVIEQIREVTERPINRLHIVGGGTQVQLLNQMTADATGLPIITGPIDASLTGNILSQAEGLGLIDSEQRRQVVRESFEIKTTQPRHTHEWDIRYDKFKAVRL